MAAPIRPPARLITTPRPSRAFPMPPVALITGHRSSRHRPCPIPTCGRTDGQCFAILGSEIRDRLEADGRKGDRWAPNRLHVWCVDGQNAEGGIFGDVGIRAGDKGLWYFALDADTPAVTLAARPATSGRQVPLVTDPDILDTLLRALAASCGLCADHRAALVARRGYAPTEIGPNARHVFACVHDTGGARPRRLEVALPLLARLAPTLGIDALLGVPGFSCDTRRRDSAIEFLTEGWAAGAGILEFARDALGRLCLYEYAPDVVLVDEKGKRGPKRYTPTRAVKRGKFHAARPRPTMATTEPQTRTHAPVWLTEATHKANVVADALRVVAAGVFGAGNYQGILEAARALATERAGVVLALDVDQWEKPGETTAARALMGLGYRVQVARWDPGADGALAGPDDALAAGVVIELRDIGDDGHRPPSPTARERRVDHAYPWMRSTRTFADHQAALNAIGATMREAVRAHAISPLYARADGTPSTDQDPDARKALLLVKAAPGLGKTGYISEIGEPSTAYPDGEIPTAWYAQRHDMHEQAPALSRYTHMLPCDAHNCPTPGIHQALLQQGYATWPLHKNHPDGVCAYYRQTEGAASIMLQVNHVGTTWGAKRPLNVVDELDLPSWIVDYEATLTRLKIAASQHSTLDPANDLLTALQALLTDMLATKGQKGAPRKCTGKALYDALDTRLGGRLQEVMAALQNERVATDTNPVAGLDFEGGDERVLAEEAEQLPPVILPHIWTGLWRELLHWQRSREPGPDGEPGPDWTSRVRIAPHRDGGYALFISNVRAFGGERHPARVLADATPPPVDVCQAIFGQPVISWQPDEGAVVPPPGTRHIAIRTGTRYGKTALVASPHGRDLQRAIAQTRYVLEQLDPDGTRREQGLVGLVTYAEIEQALAEGLGIPYVAPADDSLDSPRGRTLHFWACKGSNKLQECAILLVVGTPTLPPHEVLRMARAIYFNDPVPLDETSLTDAATGKWLGYRDPRIQRLLDYLIRSEVTQAAHRQRALRHDGRTLITFGLADVDYLPATTIVEDLPQMAFSGEGTSREANAQRRDAALSRAADELVRDHINLNCNTLAAQAQVRVQYAAKWLHERREHASSHLQNTSQVASNILFSNLGSFSEIQTAPSSPPISPPETSPDDLPPIPTDKSFWDRVIHIHQTSAGRIALDLAYFLARNERASGGQRPAHQ